MTIVEYTITDEGRIPDWISDGGYWGNPDGSDKLIGVGVEGSIPDSLETFTLAELQARERAIHANYPLKKPMQLHDGLMLEKDNMTDSEVDTAVKEWWDAR